MQSDVDSINQALAAAMADASLNNVIRQYFSNQPISTTFLGSHFVGQKRPKLVTQTAAKDLVRKLFQGGQLAGLDFPNTVVADSGHRDQPIRLIVITQTGDRDHAAHLGRGVPGAQHGVALVVTTDGCSLSHSFVVFVKHVNPAQ